MAVTTYWSPNQASIAQTETYTFTAPNSVGNTYTATINGKTITYTSISGDTAATAATGLFDLLSASTSIAPELQEITFTNPSSGVIVATASTSGIPFANLTINGVTGQGLVLSTGNGLGSGIATVHTKANASPSDVNDPQNWLRVNLVPVPPTKTRAIPVNGDDVVVSDSAISLLWNLDSLAAVRFNTYTRYQSFTGTIGLPDTNSGGYAEWRPTYFNFVGPSGSTPAGGLLMVLGYGTNGSGPGRERYDVGSQQATLTVLAAGQAIDEYAVRFKGVHTNNSFTLQGGVSLGIAMQPGETATLTTSIVDGNSTLGIGPGVTWTAASTLSLYGGTAIVNAAPATLNITNGGNVTITTDQLTWTTITAQSGSTLAMLAGGTITTLTLRSGATLDKSNDARSLTITNSTLDGDTCTTLDPMNTITWTNATSVLQQVTSGPFQFTGTRNVRIT